VRLGLLFARQVAAVKVDGQLQDPATVTLTSAGTLQGLDKLPTGQVHVALEHGLDRPPGGAMEACLDLAADAANDVRDKRLVRRGTERGDFEVFYSQDSPAGAFDIPSVEAFARRNEIHAVRLT
jgi:hypothetical protein